MVSIATVVLLAFAAGADAPAGAPEPKPTPTPPPVLQGVVKDPRGKPVEKALVVARCTDRYGEPLLQARTDASGRFRLAVAGSGPCDVRVEARGLASVRLERVRPGPPLAVTLAKGGAIEGTVRDAAGQPVPGARVEASWSRSVTWDPDAGAVSVSTDARGRFRLEGIGRGLHEITGRLRGAGSARRDNVTAGARVDLVLLSGATVSGMVIGPDRKPVEGAVVRVEKEERYRAEAALERTDPRGRYEVAGLEAGAYRIVVHRRGFAPALVSGLSLEANAEAEADLTLGFGSFVTGRLVDPADRPVRGRVTVQEIGGAETPSSLTEILRADAAEDGQFALEGVPDGAHVLAVVAPRHAPKRVEIEVPPKPTVVELGDVALDVGLAIRGRIRNGAGQPVAGAHVWGRRLARGAGLSAPAEGESEPDGVFVLAGLSEGAYNLMVSAPGFASESKTAEAGAENVDVVLKPGGTITGLVVDESGRPVEAFTVGAEAADASGRLRFGVRRQKSVTAADGVLRLEDLAEGSYAVRVAAPEYAPAVVSDVRVAPGATTDAGRIRLAAGGIVRGTVSDTAGRPVAGAVVVVLPASASFERGDEPRTASDPAGTYEIRGVPAAPTLVIGRHPEYAEAVVEGVDVDPSRGPVEVKLTMTQGARLEGTVRRRDGGSVSGYVSVWSPSADRAYAAPPRIPLRPDGSFSAEHLPPGPTEVMVMHGADGHYLSGQRRSVVLRDGETSLVEFVLRDILVSGRVTRAGVALPGVRLTLRGERSSMTFTGPPSGIPPAPRGPQRLTAVTGEDGGYTLIAEAPGKHWARIESLDGRTSFAMRPADVPDADAATIDFDLAAASIAGIVLDRETEQPLAQATVFASPVKGDGPRPRASTGADGRFELAVEDGRYRVTAGAEGHAGESVEAEVTSGTAAGELRLLLARGGALRGRVVDARGRGVGGLEIWAKSGDEPGLSIQWGSTFADGKFVIGGLPLAPHSLFAGNGLVGFAFRAGVTPGGDEVTLTLRRGGRVRLRVLGPDGAPAQGVWTTVARVDGARAEAWTVGGETDAQGEVEIAAPAGDVEITATGESLRGSVRVLVPEGGTAQGEIRLAPAEGAP